MFVLCQHFVSSFLFKFSSRYYLFGSTDKKVTMHHIKVFAFSASKSDNKLMHFVKASNRKHILWDTSQLLAITTVSDDSWYYYHSSQAHGSTGGQRP